MVARNGDGTFKRGSSGNPRGRPPGRSARDAARDALLKNGGRGFAAWIERLMESDDPKAAAVVVDVLQWMDGPAPPAPDSSVLAHEDALEMLMSGVDEYDAARPDGF